ncbi:conserved unknown protein [Ectocarpus siliculosus]|uniref:Uncharacterized protein n=1 Tax=Ectocarpus siliculosus TaxID=2880 RepID=D8LQM5_ECTSI|nr:conserved unknown protein [Ectocarpus siliculosus]|eukprot:CBN78789.1 conserved unknown protein [Ectocarpus siliculosus]
MVLMLAREDADAGVMGVEMIEVKGGCLQVTLKAGEHMKADPRCIVSRGVGLALRPPAPLEKEGILGGLKQRLRKAAQGRQDQQQQQQHRDNHRLERVSNTMASNETDCFFAPPFPGDVAVVSVSSGGGDESVGEERRDYDDAHGGDRRKARQRQEGRGGDRPAARGSRHGSDKPRKLVLLTQAIVAVGPGVVVKPSPLPDAGGGGRGGSSLSRRQQQRGGPVVTTGVLSLCEGQGQIAVAGYGKLKKLRLRPGQKRLVDSSRAVGWTSGVTCLTGTGGRASVPTTGNNNGANSPAGAFTTFVGPGTVYVQTHSLPGLRRLLLPKSGVSLQGGVPSGLLGTGGRGAGALFAPRGGPPTVGLSLKRGLAKRAKAGAKRVSLAVAFFALYLVVYSLVTALLLEGRDGLANAPRHAVQVVRSLSKVARRVAVVLVRLGREELWREGEGGGVTPPQKSLAER